MRRISGVGKATGVIISGVLALAGCSSSGGSGGAGYSIADAVDQVPPATVEENVLIYTGDLLRASEIAGLERPDDLDDATDWLFELTRGAPSDNVDVPIFVPVGDMTSAGANFGGLEGLEGFEDELGWSLLDIDSFVEVSNPPATLAVMTGDFDEDILEGLDDLDDGVFSHGSGDDFSHDLNNRSSVDQLGRPIRFAERDGRLVMSTSTPAVEEWLDGEGGSGLDDLKAIADALDNADAYSAVLHSPESGFDVSNALGNAPSEVVEQVGDQDWLPTEAFHSVGIGWSADDGDAVVTFVFAHDDADAAEDNVESFEAMFTEGASITSGRSLDDLYDLREVTTDDNLVIVTVRPGDDAPISAAFQGLTSRDAPFVHR